SVPQNGGHCTCPPKRGTVSTSTLLEIRAMQIEAEVKVEKKFEVKIIYNGVDKKLELQHGEVVKQVLDQAVQIFSPLPQPHMMALFNEAGAELNDGQTVDAAGINPKDRLLL